MSDNRCHKAGLECAHQKHYAIMFAGAKESDPREPNGIAANTTPGIRWSHNT